MDFSTSENYSAVADLASDIFNGEVGDGYHSAFEDSGEPFDRALWQTLSEAGLVALCIEERFGGSGFGMEELAGVLEAQGRVLAPVPLLVNSLAAMAVQQYDGEGLGKTLLEEVAAGRMILSLALDDSRPRYDGSVLSGRAQDVPFTGVADGLVIAADREDDEPVLVYVSADQDGLQIMPQRSTSGEPRDIVEFADCRIEPGQVIASGNTALEWVKQRTLTALSAMQLGVSTAALEQTVTYAGERKQFGRPIASFQAVTHRAADGYVDCEALRSVVWQAAWRLSAGLDAAVESRSAKWWAAETGHRTAHTAQHLHGGIGSDRDYPIHRYFLASKQIEFSLGGARAQLADTGRVLADRMDTGVRV